MNHPISKPVKGRLSVAFFAERVSWLESMWLESLSTSIDLRTDLVTRGLVTDFGPFMARPDAEVLVVGEMAAIDYVTRYWPSFSEAHPDVRVVLLEMPSDRAVLGRHPAFTTHLSSNGQFDALVAAIRGERGHLPIEEPIDDPDVLRRELFRDLLDANIGLLVAGGLEDREIAEALNVSHQTVRARIHRLLDRSGFRNRTQMAVALAMRGGDCDYHWMAGLSDSGDANTP